MAGRRDRADRQRLRRRARGRADLRLRVRPGPGGEAGAAAVAVLDDEDARSREAFEHLRPGEEMKPLEEAARSRSEADWVVGMNATRAASIRLRAAFDGAVSLGRVQTPTLALVARREEEIRAFKPEPYWLVEARFEASGERRYIGPLPGRQAAADRGRGDRRSSTAVEGKPGEITKLEKKEEREQPQLLYDLTSLQRHANTPLRLLGAAHAVGGAAALRGAQGAHLSAYQLALPDRRHGRRDQADRRAGRPQRRSTRRRPSTCWRSTSCRSAAWSTTRRSRTTTRSSPRAPSTTSAEDGPGRAEGLRPGGEALPRRSSIPRRCSSARASRRPSREHVFRTSGRRLVEAGWKAVYGERGRAGPRGEDDSGGDQLLPKLEQGEAVETLRGRVDAQGDPAAAALHRRLAARRDGDRRQGGRGRRAARGDEGLRHRHAGHARVDHRAAGRPWATSSARAARWWPPRRAIQVIRLLGEHQLTSPELTGSWERRLRADRAGRGHAARRSCATSPKFTDRDGRRSSTS